MRLRLLFSLSVLALFWWLAGRPGADALVALVEGARTGANAPRVEAATGRPVVVLSPGFGWWSADAKQIDPGGEHAGLVEKDVALDVAQQAQEILSRCPLDVRLTRTGDDSQHTLANVHEIVNSDHPALAVAVHTSAADAPSGARAFYTVDGADDVGSKRLSSGLAGAVAARLALPDLGAQPETDSPNRGLYIHPWQAPAALLDLGSLGADAQALRNRRSGFARALAEGVLNYLSLPTECADGLQLLNAAGLVAVTFANQPLSQDLTVQNDGLADWDPTRYTLVAAGEAYGAANGYALPARVAPGQTATWALPARAPAHPGVYEQRWQLMRDNAPVGPVLSVLIVVVPPQAQALKDKLDQQVAEWQAAGSAKADDLMKQMQTELKDWAVQQAQKQAANCLGVNGALVLVSVVVATQRQRKPHGSQ
jgi:N-acetylmuramoyl-L-alanine amidase